MKTDLGNTIDEGEEQEITYETDPHYNNQGDDLNTSVATISSRYRHENQNSVYFFRPNSTEIYLLDFKLKGFCKETLKWRRGQGVIPL